jgi:DNA invertase Pin-like site-specific DNA recombinase
VSTSGQNLNRQTRALTEAGCIRVFADTLPGKTAYRPELAPCLDYLRAGDTVVVSSLDRVRLTGGFDACTKCRVADLR